MQKPSKSVGTDANAGANCLLYGNWEYNNNETGTGYRLNLSSAGEIGHATHCPPYTLKKPANIDWSFQLPRKGKNIKVIYLNDNYSEKSITVLKWNGENLKIKNEELE